MSTDIVSANLRLEHGVSPAEFDHVTEVFARLDQRLRSFDGRAIDLRLYVKERDTPSQHTTLEAVVAGHPAIIATSRHTDFDLALEEVRDDMVRQLTDTKNLAEPQNNRARRERA